MKTYAAWCVLGVLATLPGSVTHVILSDAVPEFPVMVSATIAYIFGVALVSAVYCSATFDLGYYWHLFFASTLLPLSSPLIRWHSFAAESSQVVQAEVERAKDAHREAVKEWEARLRRIRADDSRTKLCGEKRRTLEERTAALDQAKKTERNQFIRRLARARARVVQGMEKAGCGDLESRIMDLAGLKPMWAPPEVHHMSLSERLAKVFGFLGVDLSISKIACFLAHIFGLVVRKTGLEARRRMLRRRRGKSSQEPSISSISEDCPDAVILYEYYETTTGKKFRVYPVEALDREIPENIVKEGAQYYWHRLPVKGWSVDGRGQCRLILDVTSYRRIFVDTRDAYRLLKTGGHLIPSTAQ